MSESLEQRLDRLGAEAEAGELDQTLRPIPPHVKVSRPNQARSRVLQVRLTDGEFAALEQLAAGLRVPVSAVARQKLLEVIERNAEDAGGSLSSLADELDRLASRLRGVKPRA